MAYYFGRRLHKTLNVPIGLINTSWGGTPAEAWTSLPALQVIPEYAPLGKRWAEYIAAYPEAQEEYQTRLAFWQANADSLRALGQRVREDRGEIRIVPIVRLRSTMG